MTPQDALKRIETKMASEVYLKVGDDIDRAIEMGEIKSAEQVLVEYLRLLRERLSDD